MTQSLFYPWHHGCLCHIQDLLLPMECKRPCFSSDMICQARHSRWAFVGLVCDARFSALLVGLHCCAEIRCFPAHCCSFPRVKSAGSPARYACLPTPGKNPGMRSNYKQIESASCEDFYTSITYINLIPVLGLYRGVSLSLRALIHVDHQMDCFSMQRQGSTEVRIKTG